MIDLTDSKRVLRDKLEDAYDLAEYLADLDDGTGAHYVDLVVCDLIKNAYAIVKRQVEDQEDGHGED